MCVCVCVVRAHVRSFAAADRFPTDDESRYPRIRALVKIVYFFPLVLQCRPFELSRVIATRTINIIIRFAFTLFGRT